ncbi:MAG: hypothetical protein DKM22_05070 [Candidatus Melainabacteria bacterium]|nr:MAG: hypothetical protein DKM22_05070 [Candidatus Melainabacteria bacterium]
MPENFKFDRELFEKALHKDVADKNILLMDDLSKVKLYVEKALEVCLDTTANISQAEYRGVGI